MRRRPRTRRGIAHAHAERGRARGSGYKTYGDSLLGQMALQLKVTKADLVDLVKCPLDGPGYVEKLRDRGIRV